MRQKDQKRGKKIKMLQRCSWFYFLMNRNKKKYSINNTTGKNSRRSSQNTYSSPTGSRTTERPPEDWQSVWSNDPTGSGSHKGRRRGEKQKERKKERAGATYQEQIYKLKILHLSSFFTQTLFRYDGNLKAHSCLIHKQCYILHSCQIY